MRGTTPSGHPTLTTLGNTLRELCYLYFYISTTGILNPWRLEVQQAHRVFVIAAGDDGVIWCKPRDVPTIVTAIQVLTSTTMEG